MSPSPSNVRADYPTFTDVVTSRAADQRDKAVFLFLNHGQDGAAEETTLTFGGLEARARIVAAELQRIGAQGQRVLLLYPPGLEFIVALFGCFYAGAIAVPAYPPGSAKRTSMWSRLRGIIANATPRAALTTSTIQPRLFASLPTAPGEALSFHIVATDTLDETLAEQYRSPAINPNDLACLQYTSGSTAEPRGVMLTHANLIDNSKVIQRASGHCPQTQGVTWLPPYHDMGLIGGILQPLYVGFPIVMMAPTAFIQQPIRWLQAISRFGATSTAGPNFSYDLCVEKTTPQQRAELDLSRWQCAFNGAEPIDPATIERFSNTFGPCGFRREAFYPCYGLAEATLMVSGREKGDGLIITNANGGQSSGASSQQHVSCGKPFSRDSAGLVVIVDPLTHVLCEDQTMGEIWVAGPSVAKGYWGKDRQTAETFSAHLADTGQGPFLRTGDLGFLRDGQLFVTGRLKDLIILRGVNYPPHEIERTVQASHPALQPGAGAAVEIRHGNRSALAVFQELRRDQRGADTSEVIRRIRAALSTEHELAPAIVILLQPGAAPRTPSGKVQRYLCRTMLENASLQVVARWEDASALTGKSTPDEALNYQPPPADANCEQIEIWLIQITARLLGRSIHDVDPQEPFAGMGIESIDAVNLALAIVDAMGVRLSENVFWDYPCIRDLANFLANQPRESKAASQSVAEQD